MLKYDFDRTSTSWSKNRSLGTVGTEGTENRPKRNLLNETRVTDK